MWDAIINESEPLTLERGDDRAVLEYWDGGRQNLYFDPEDPLDAPCWHLAHYHCNAQGSWDLVRGFRTRFNLQVRPDVLACWLGQVLTLIRTGEDYAARLQESGSVLNDPEVSPEAWKEELVGAAT